MMIFVKISNKLENLFATSSVKVINKSICLYNYIVGDCSDIRIYYYKAILKWLVLKIEFLDTKIKLLKTIQTCYYNNLFNLCIISEDSGALH